MMMYLDNIPISEYNLCLSERPEIPTAEQDIETIQIRGRDGSLTKKFGFKDKPYKLTFNFLEDTSFKEAFRKFKMALLTSKIMEFSDDPGLYNKIKYVSIDTAANDILEYGEFTVTFTLDPFDYEKDSELITVINDTELYNPGWEACPYLKIYGSGSGKIYINDGSFQVNGITDFIEVDCDMMNAYKTVDGIITSMDDKMVGAFPLLQSGRNTIDFDGGITKIEIIPRWRWI